MKDRKLTSLLVASVSLFILAIGLLSVWGYFYLRDRTKTTDSSTAKPSAKEIASMTVRDSLEKNYTAAVTKLNTSLPAIESLPDSSKRSVDSNVRALYKLRDEIPSLLADKNSVTNLDSARFKITQLNRRIDELLTRTQEVEQENKRLYKALNQLRNQVQSQQATNTFSSSRPSTTGEEQAPVTITEARLWANDGAGGATASAEQAEKFSGSFVVRKAKGSAPVADVYVVVVQPDGRVLKVSDWESGAFETAEGRKMYSTKLVFDEFKGESRRLNFAVSGENFQKGAYTLQLYQNGNRVGRASTTLL